MLIGNLCLTAMKRLSRRSFVGQTKSLLFNLMLSHAHNHHMRRASLRCIRSACADIPCLLLEISVFQGFARFLHTLATHDWKTVPLVVDLDAQQTPLSTEDVETAWSSRRATAPASSGDGTASTETCKEALEVFIASSYDLDVSVWTTPAQPSATALRRMQVFASASASRICS